MCCKELVETKRIPAVWKYFLATKDTDRKKKIKPPGGTVPILGCITNLMKYDFYAVLRVIEPELEEVGKLLDDELSDQWDSGIVNLQALISCLTVRWLPSTVESMGWFQKVIIFIVYTFELTSRYLFT
jgi:hypothetical protein